MLCGPADRAPGTYQCGNRLRDSMPASMPDSVPDSNAGDALDRTEPSTQDPPIEDPRPDGLRNAKSLLLVNTGNGKGKSSAAFGVMTRGVARGWKVAVLQFIKSGDWKVGEEAVGRQLGVEWRALGHG